LGREERTERDRGRNGEIGWRGVELRLSGIIFIARTGDIELKELVSGKRLNGFLAKGLLSSKGFKRVAVSCESPSFIKSRQIVLVSLVYAD
jgi:hypothetical protein